MISRRAHDVTTPVFFVPGDSYPRRSPSWTLYHRVTTGEDGVQQGK
ncbi:MAG: hypothetical protein LLF84_04310 [Methanoregulaceae archaeon]|nr:hypothetical protein [Methanoregulaceae archaeon]